MQKTLFRLQTYAEFRVFTGLEYLILYSCNAYPKSELAIVYLKVSGIVKTNIKYFFFSRIMLNLSRWLCMSRVLLVVCIVVALVSCACSNTYYTRPDRRSLQVTSTSKIIDATF